MQKVQRVALKISHSNRPAVERKRAVGQSQQVRPETVGCFVHKWAIKRKVFLLDLPVDSEEYKRE